MLLDQTTSKRGSEAFFQISDLNHLLCTLCAPGLALCFRLSMKLQESEKYEGTERRYFFSHFLNCYVFYKHGETSCDGLDYWEFSDVSHAHILWEKILW